MHDDLANEALDTTPEVADAPESGEAPENAAPAEETEGADAPVVLDENSESAVEDPVVALKRHLRSAPGEWYVIHSYSGHETV